MKKRKKQIGKMVLACLPLLVFLACGSAEETESLTELLQKQESISGREEAPDEAAGEGVLVPAGSECEVQTAFVYICGEVAAPGVYEVRADCRICDVLLLAGGFTKEADQGSVNLASMVQDGMQIKIPSRAEAAEEQERQMRQREGLVNLNTASAAELCTLPGIGESRAAAILSYREKQGGFQTKEEIMQVTGIKEGMYEKIKDRIFVE